MKHGRAGRQDRTYGTWTAMRARCNNPRHRRYADWGGRGITVCERWNSFENFLADMGEKPCGLTLERRDNDRGYEPDNCYWGTWTDQARNRRSSRLSEADITQIRAAWATSPHFGRGRLASGAGSRGLRQRDLAEMYGVSQPTIVRILKGA